MTKPSEDGGRPAERQAVEKKGGYPAGDKPASELKPPPRALTRGKQEETRAAS